jgi:hypothetical protein
LGADACSVGYEDAIARVNELRSLQTGAPLPAARPAQAAGNAQFAQQLQTAMQSGDPAAAGAQPNAPFGAAGMPQPNPYAAGGMPQGAGYPMPGGTPNLYSLSPQQLHALYGPAAAGRAQGPAPTTMLTGDTQGLSRQLLSKLNQVGERLGQKVDIRSGFRSRAEQAELYQRFLNGTGNLAAPPGKSNHESGKAADVYIGGVALGSHPQGRRIAESLGLGWPVGGEPWHTELVRG